MSLIIMSLCVGIRPVKGTNLRASCYKMAIHPSIYCENHSYLKNYSNEEIERLRNGEGRSCHDCRKLHFGSLSNCNYCSYKATNQRRNKFGTKKCIMVLSNGNTCRRYRLPNKDYCPKHTYMEDYTDYQKKHLSICRGCNNMKYKIRPDGSEPSTCFDCLEKVRDKMKESRKEIAEAKIIYTQNWEPPKIEPIKSIRYRKTREDTFIFDNPVLYKNKNTNVTVAMTDRIDNSFKEKQNEYIVKLKKTIKIADNMIHPEEYYVYPNTNFNAKVKEHCNIKAYNRQNGILNVDWRIINPDIMSKYYKIPKITSEKKYFLYQAFAEARNIEFELSFENCRQLFNSNCFYCGLPAQTQFVLNGIDIDNRMLGYTMDNCKSACIMCYNMKFNIFDTNGFISYAEHILTRMQLIRGRTNHELIKDHVSIGYKSYMVREIKETNTRQCTKLDSNYFKISKKEREFLHDDLDIIDRDDYDVIRDKECYLCGKKNSSCNFNGVNKANPSITSTRDNSESCCGTCSGAKSSLFLDDFLRILSRICLKHGIIQRDIDDNIDVMISQYLENRKI